MAEIAPVLFDERSRAPMRSAPTGPAIGPVAAASK